MSDLYIMNQTFPELEFLDGPQIENCLQSSEIVIYESEVLVLNGRTDLQDRAACENELDSHVRRVDSPGGQNGEAGQRSGD